MRSSRLATALLFLTLAPAAGVPAREGPATAPAADAQVILVSDDWPDWTEEVGRLTLKGVDPAVMEATPAEFRRLALADTEASRWLPDGYQIYQTISTAEILTVNVNLVVDARNNAMCFNPEIPYCVGFERINPLLRATGRRFESAQEAGSLARFLVEIGQSTVHRPDNFIYLRLRQKIPLEHYDFLRNIQSIYLPENEPFRTEARRAEVERVVSRYGDVVRPVTLTETAAGFRLHGFTYKIMRASGDLREWDVLVRRDGTVKIKIETLEKGVGELTWSFAP